MAVCSESSKNQNMKVGPSGIGSEKTATDKSQNYNFGNTLSFPLLGESNSKKLTKGVYEINAFVDVGNEKPVSVDNFTENIEVDGQIKQVRFKRVTISRPTKDANGKKLSKLNAVVSIDENPIPIAIIVWGAVGATGLTAGGYFINSVNRFTENSFNQFIAVAGLLASAYFAFK